jgi:acyl-CoA synthetase (NDP forming)
VDALFRQAGVIRTETLEGLFDVAALLAHQPIPKGPRVAILTNAGGPGILAADACEANGLELPELSERTRDELRSFLPAAASVGNPVDMLASAPPEHYRRALAAILRDEHVDSVLTIFIPPLVTQPDAVATAIVEGSRDAEGKPVAAIFMRAEGAPEPLAPVPCYAFPESAAIALASVTAYGRWRNKPLGTPAAFEDINVEDARRVVDGALARGGGWLSAVEAQAVMSAIGIETPPTCPAAGCEEAVAAAAAIGYPVVVKALGPALVHKTEHRAVHVNLTDANAVRAACADLQSRLRENVTGFLVQRMVDGGVEMLVGALHDPMFGPLVVCGGGGVLVDLVADTAFRLHPLTIEDAGEMVDELRSARLLRGYRGTPPADEEALREAMLRVSVLLEVCLEIQELDINPLTVQTNGACAVDVRVRVEPLAPRPRTRRIEY